MNNYTASGSAPVGLLNEAETAYRSERKAEFALLERRKAREWEAAMTLDKSATKFPRAKRWYQQFAGKNGQAPRY